MEAGTIKQSFEQASWNRVRTEKELAQFVTAKLTNVATYNLDI